MIASFDGEYRWLSNFWPCEIRGQDLVYPSAEHAYQAAKCKDRTQQIRFITGTASQAKKLGRAVEIRADWEDIKIDVMRSVLARKFAIGSELAAKLLATGAEELVEGNYWNDTFWGVCRGQGKNWLGKLLMERREQLRPRSQAEVINVRGLAANAPGVIYCGRGFAGWVASPLGNPCSIPNRPCPVCGKVHFGPGMVQLTADRSLTCYQLWLADQVLQNNAGVIEALEAIAAKLRAGETVKLGCWCRPQSCHCDVILEVVKEML